MSRDQQKSHQQSAAERQFVSKDFRTQVLKTVSQRIHTPNGKTLEQAAHSKPGTLLRSELGHIQEAVVSGRADVVASLEETGLLKVSHPKTLERNIGKNEDWTDLAGLCGLNTKELSKLSVTDLHAMYRRIMPRYVADAIGRGDDFVVGIGRDAERMFLYGVIRPALTEEHFNMLTQALDIEDDFHKSMIGVSRINSENGHLVASVGYRETRRYATAVIATGRDSEAVNQAVSYILRKEPSTREQMAEALKAVSGDIEEPKPEEITAEGEMGDALRAAQEAKVKMLKHQVNIAAVRMKAPTSQKRPHYYATVGGVTDRSGVFREMDPYTYNVIGSLAPEDKEKRHRIFQSEALLPTEPKAPKVTDPKGVFTYTQRVSNDSDVFILSPEMHWGLETAVANLGGEDMLEKTLALISSLPDLSAKDRIDIVGELALIGFKQKPRSMIGVVIQTPNDFLD